MKAGHSLTFTQVTLIATVRNPDEITHDVLMARLKQLGPIEHWWYPNELECATYDLPSGCLCFRYSHFADFQDVRSVSQAI